MNSQRLTREDYESKKMQYIPVEMSISELHNDVICDSNDDYKYPNMDSDGWTQD